MISKMRATTPRMAASRPNTTARDAVTSGFVVRSRTEPTTRSIVSAMSAAQFGSVNGLPGMAEETSPRHRGVQVAARNTIAQSSSETAA